MEKLEKKINKLEWYNLPKDLKKLLSCFLKDIQDLQDGGQDIDIPDYTLTPISETNNLILAKDGVAVSSIDLTPYLDKGLEKITEGGSSGWRLVGKNAGNYGDIGFEAVDISESDGSSTTRGATGSYAFSAGYRTTSQGTGSASFGINTESLAQGSFACGEGNSTIGSASLIGGNNNTASGSNTFTVGVNNNNQSPAGVVLGSSNTLSISGGNSLMLGFGNTSSSSSSITTGFNNNNNSNESLALGRFSVDRVSADDNTDTAIVVGNGTAEGSRSDAFRVRKDGVVAYNPTTEPTNPERGMVYYDSTTNKLRCYDGTIWNDLF